MSEYHPRWDRMRADDEIERTPTAVVVSARQKPHLSPIALFFLARLGKDGVVLYKYSDPRI